MITVFMVISSENLLDDNDLRFSIQMFSCWDFKIANEETGKGSKRREEIELEKKTEPKKQIIKSPQSRPLSERRY